MNKTQVERLIITAQHSNPQTQILGIANSTTIVFGFRFTSPPVVKLTPMAAVGTPECWLISKDKTGGYWTGMTIHAALCDEVDWEATGSGIDL